MWPGYGEHNFPPSPCISISICGQHRRTSSWVKPTGRGIWSTEEELISIFILDTCLYGIHILFTWQYREHCGGSVSYPRVYGRLPSISCQLWRHKSMPIFQWHILCCRRCVGCRTAGAGSLSQSRVYRLDTTVGASSNALDLRSKAPVMTT